MNKLFKRITISVFLFLSMFVIITPTSAEEEVIEKKLYVLDTSIENEISYEDMITEIAEIKSFIPLELKSIWSKYIKANDKVTEKTANKADFNSFINYPQKKIFYLIIIYYIAFVKILHQL